MILTAFRHAPVALSGVCYGQLDVEAAVPAEEAVAIVREQLADHTVMRVFSSPLSRCAAPARALASRLSVPHVVDARLAEIAYGAWEGRAWEAIARDDSAAYAEWMASWKTKGPPGGESALDMEHRISTFWDELHGEETTVLIAHAGVIRALRVIVRGASWEDAMSSATPHLAPEIFATRR